MFGSWPLTLADSWSWWSLLELSGFHLAHINVSEALPVSVYNLSLVRSGTSRAGKSLKSARRNTCDLLLAHSSWKSRRTVEIFLFWIIERRCGSASWWPVRCDVSSFLGTSTPAWYHWSPYPGKGVDMVRAEAVPHKRLDGSRGFKREVESLSYRQKGQWESLICPRP